MPGTNKEIVQKVNTVFATDTLHLLPELCTEDIRWTMLGHPPVHGKEGVRQIIDYMKGYRDMELIPHNIIAEGDHVACNGIMSMTNPDGSIYKGAFCDVYLFRDGKIAAIDSYTVALKDAP